MPRNSKALPAISAVRLRDPQFAIRAVLGVLLVLNLGAAALVLYPPGGSADDLEHQLATLQSQVAQRRVVLERSRQHVSAVEKGRAEGDDFLKGYFLSRRTAYSTLLGELNAAAKQSQIKPRGDAYSTEPVEGSDTLSMMTITANYEGTYKDVLNFVHEIDKSSRLLIIDSLSAAPQQGSNLLSLSMKIDTFVRDDSPAGSEAAQ